MLDIVIATRNPHKFRELRGLLPRRGIRWHSLAEFPAVGVVEEQGRSFKANAVTKAQAVAKATHRLALADDSGLVVVALGGAPGIRSARFAGRHGDDQANNAKLLRVLQGRPASKRAAQYQCVLALASASRVIAVTRGSWKGRIAATASGRGGFGYDPIFFVVRLGKTVGQLSAAAKQRLSHRAQAARRMTRVLRQLASTNRV